MFDQWDALAHTAFFDLAANFRHDLNQREKEMWDRAIGKLPSADVVSACKKLMRDPEQKYFPRSAEFMACVPNRDKEAPIPAWWHLDGTWGGDWKGYNKSRLNEISLAVLRRKSQLGVWPHMWARHEEAQCQLFLEFLYECGADAIAPREPVNG